MTFISQNIVFDSKEQGEDAIAKFSFTNTGQVPLIISDVVTSCGCTKTFWSKQPILPGEKGSISLKYEASTLGQFRKIATALKTT